MSSICIQYQLKSLDHPYSGGTTMADLHINYWKLPKSRGFERFMDFGLLIHNLTSDITAISLYLPVNIPRDNVFDLGKYIADGNMMSHLFNGNYMVSNVIKSNSFYTAECNETSKPSFLLYSFGKHFNVEKMSVGSRIVIPIGEFPDETNLIKQKNDNLDSSVNRELYIRFRIENIQDKDFGHIEAISNDFLQSAFSKMEMLNFHINEFREIPVDDSEEIQKGWNYFSFSKIHFYFIGSSEDEKVTGHKSYKDSRLLDYHKWRSYLNNHNSKQKQCIAYHWKYEKDDKLDNMPTNIFIRTVYSSLQPFKILKYCFIILLLGFVGSLLANFFYDLFERGISYKNGLQDLETTIVSSENTLRDNPTYKLKEK